MRCRGELCAKFLKSLANSNQFQIWDFTATVMIEVIGDEEGSQFFFIAIICCLSFFKVTCELFSAIPFIVGSKGTKTFSNWSIFFSAFVDVWFEKL